MAEQVTSFASEIIGEVTGFSAAGVMCTGLVFGPETVCAMIGMIGPQNGIVAARVQMNVGNSAPVKVHTVGGSYDVYNKGMSSQYVDYTAKIPVAKVTSSIVVHKNIVAPNYYNLSADNWAGFFVKSEADETWKKKMLNHIKASVNIPIFPQWLDYLLDEGKYQGLYYQVVQPKIRRDVPLPGPKLYVAFMRPTSWQEVVQDGLRKRKIRIAQ